MFKRALPVVFSLTLVCICANAQQTPQEHFPKKYINLSFSSQTLSQTGTDHDDDFSLKSNFGGAFTVGRTYFVHKQPVAKMIKFGIDATFFDISYGNYSQKWTDDYYDDENFTVKYHQADIGMQVGPSVMVNPASKLNVSAYFRYAPTFSLIYVSEDSDVYGNYASFFVGGGAVTYGKVGLGVEARFGKGNYKRFGGGGEDDDYYDYEDYYQPSKLSLKTSGVRVYLTFRF